MLPCGMALPRCWAVVCDRLEDKALQALGVLGFRVRRSREAWCRREKGFGQVVLETSVGSTGPHLDAPAHGWAALALVRELRAFSSTPPPKQTLNPKLTPPPPPKRVSRNMEPGSLGS